MFFSAFFVHINCELYLFCHVTQIVKDSHWIVTDYIILHMIMPDWKQLDKILDDFYMHVVADCASDCQIFYMDKPYIFRFCVKLLQIQNGLYHVK